MVAPLAALLALVEDRPGDAVTRAGEGVLLDAVERIIERRFPGAAIGRPGGAAAMIVGGGARHADPPARRLDHARLGQRLDEGVLLLDRPAVDAAADGDGIEEDDWIWF